ncbi:MAG: hypothetical protein KDA61_20120, partial [Planctomycetales bacterium]|nr:hypothetical protein [Planctomycetales bacterium]
MQTILSRSHGAGSRRAQLAQPGTNRHLGASVLCRANVIFSRGLLYLAWIGIAAWASHSAASANQVFELTCPQVQLENLPVDQHPLIPRVIYRELARQAVLIAAREECGCTTRDAALYEPHVEEPGERHEIQVGARHGVGLHVVLRKRDSVVWEGDVEEAIGPIFDVRGLAAKLTTLVTQDLAVALIEHGLSKDAAEWDENGEAPESAEILAREMNGVSQFRALRILHQTMRSSGESPERLAALGRIYSHLACLNASTLDSRGVAYRARAMLYAERAVQRSQMKPLTLWSRAYVYAMIGLPTIALQDLDEAARVSQGTDASPPDWVSLIDDYCHYRYPDLESAAKAADSPHSQIAAVLWFRSALNSGSQSLTLETGKQALAIAPGCLWMIDAMHDAAGVAYGHATSSLPPAYHAHLLGTELLDADEIPQAVRSDLARQFPLRDSRQIAEVGRTLSRAGDDAPSEPSLAMLGQDILAQNTLHIARRGHFIRNDLGADASGYIASVEEAFKDDAWAPLIRALALPRQSPATQYAPILKDFSVREGNYLSSQSLFDGLSRELKLKDMQLGEARDLIYHAMGGTEFEYLYKLRSQNIKKWRVQYAKWMADCSVHCPMRFAVLIREDFAESAPRLDEWQREYGTHPCIAAALGEAYVKQGEYERAIPLLERSLAAASDYRTIQYLADARFQLTDGESWITTLQRAFDLEDYSLSHATAAATIAATLMHDGRFTDALPWAEKASESGAGWAWDLEMRCRTALGQYDEAESLARQNSERYGTTDWLYFCVRTGHGDLEQAWKATQQIYRQQRKDPNDTNVQFATAFYQIASGQKQACVASLKEQLERQASPVKAFMAYTIAGEIDDRESRLWLEQ